MKTRNYKHGSTRYKAYCKPVGKGYEVGFMCGSKPLFVGNFLHAKEANAWYTKMNNEIAKFAKKYWITDRSPKTFYHRFISHNLYKLYYTFLDRTFNQYNTKFNREFNKSVRKYNQMKKRWEPVNKVPLKRAA